MPDYKKYVSDYPELLAEWDNERNVGLNPSDETAGSHKIIWWRCKNKHLWKAMVKNRTKGIGCPYCSGRYVSPGVNDLATVYPELAVEWDYTKNGDLLPSNVTFGSGKKVWWKCFICGYEWQAVISSRTRTGSAKCGCPLCSNQTVVPGVNDLATSFPELLEEWDYQKNKGISPDSVCAGSAKKAWWKCRKCGRSWQAENRNRSQKGICIDFRCSM